MPSALGGFALVSAPPSQAAGFQRVLHDDPQLQAAFLQFA